MSHSMSFHSHLPLHAAATRASMPRFQGRISAADNGLVRLQARETPPALSLPRTKENRPNRTGPQAPPSSIEIHSCPLATAASASKTPESRSRVREETSFVANALWRISWRRRRSLKGEKRHVKMPRRRLPGYRPLAMRKSGSGRFATSR